MEALTKSYLKSVIRETKELRAKLDAFEARIQSIHDDENVEAARSLHVDAKDLVKEAADIIAPASLVDWSLE